MKFTEVTFQDRESWLKWRKGGIGSSDASIIMDVSRFKSREELRNEKVTGIKLDDSVNQYVKDRGNKIEGFVRSALSDRHNTDYQPINCIHNGFEFIRASLDGISSDKKTLIEIKLLSIVNPEKPNYESAGYLKWVAASQGEVPFEYWPQVQHQLLVTGAERCYFVGYKEIKGQVPNPEGNLAIVEVLPNLEYIRMLANKEFEFWFQVQERKQALGVINE